MGRGGGLAEIRHQRAELRPLQNLRHQGPESEHYLGSSRGLRRTELSEYVTTSCQSGHDTATSGLSSSCLCAPLALFLRARCKKAILGATLAVRAHAAPLPPLWSIASDSFELRP